MSFDITQSHLDTFSGNNAHLEINGSDAVVGDTVSSGDTLTAVADAYYEFNTSSDGCEVVLEGGYDPVEGGNVETKFTCNGDGTATLAYTGEDASNGFYVSTYSTFTGIRILTQSDIDVATNNNATLKVNGSVAVAGDGVSEGDTFSIVADEGYIFYKPDGDSSDCPSGVWFGGYSASQGGNEYYCLTLNEDSNLATRNITQNDEWRDGLTVNTKIPTPDVLGTNNVYKITESQFDTVNQERFSLATNGNFDDYGVFILGLIKFPTEIPSIYLIDPATVVLGDKDTSVSAPKLAADIIPIELGSISVGFKFDNAKDYRNTTCKLFLPFASPIEIEPNYVIGETISIEYHINCYTGIASILVKTTRLGDVNFITKEVDLGISIPYIANTKAEKENVSLEIGSDNKIRKPFIEVARYHSILENGFFTVPVTVEELLSEQDGYIEVEQINLEVKASIKELEEIKRTLENGVIINAGNIS